MRAPVQIAIENSYAQLAGCTQEEIALLRHDLAYAPREAMVPPPGQPFTGLEYLLSPGGSFPAGLVPQAKRLLEKYLIPWTQVDLRRCPEEDLPLHSAIQLRPYQERLRDRALELERGVIDSPPRSGKTTVLGSIIDKNPLPTLWIAPTLGIVRQTVRALKKLLSLGPNDDGVIDCTGGWPTSMVGRRTAMAARIVVTTYASAVKFPESFYRTRKILVIDEHHHSASSTIQEISRLASPIYYRYGATGTNFRSDDNTEILMHAVLSEIIGRVTVREMVDGGWLVPADIVMVPIQSDTIAPMAHDATYKLGITRNKERNQWVSHCTSQLEAGGRKVLVLVKHIEHGETLAQLIKGSTFIQGEDPEHVEDCIDAFNSGKISVLIGTSVLGEGRDLPAADALVYAKGGSASVTVTQDFFRVLTGAEGKYPAIVVDFCDRHAGVLLAQSCKRGALYAKEEAFQVTVASTMKDLDRFFAPIQLLGSRT